jgi:hypothetical protein
VSHVISRAWEWTYLTLIGISAVAIQPGAFLNIMTLADNINIDVDGRFCKGDVFKDHFVFFCLLIESGFWGSLVPFPCRRGGHANVRNLERERLRDKRPGTMLVVRQLTRGHESWFHSLTARACYRSDF